MFGFLKLFTQKVAIYSPTYYRKLKDGFETQDQDFPRVKMTADIIVQADTSGEEAIDVLVFTIRNKMWEDPIQEGEDEDASDKVELEFKLTRNEAIYLSKHIEGFITSTTK